MKILFWYHKSRTNKKGKAPLIMRITIDGIRANFNIGIVIQEDKWDSEDQRIKGKDQIAKEYNNLLVTLTALAWECYNNHLKNNLEVSPEIIKSFILEKDKPQHTLLEAISFQIINLKSRVGNDITTNTVKKYETIQRKVKEFLKEQLKVDDIQLNQLTQKFIFQLDDYFRTKQKLKHNAVAKNMQQFRRVIKIAIQNEWIERDPFVSYSCTPKSTERGFLTMEEIQFFQKEILTEKLDKVRDIFLFCCFTGLSYADVSKFNKEHLMQAEDGKTWIILARTKTKSQSFIPILPEAMTILTKYGDIVKWNSSGKLLPVISNQNLNKYLKEIANVIGINKRVSMHLARHTFATTVTLNRGVDIVSVSKMLGHKNLQTTQIYAKTGMLRISQDMDKFFEKGSFSSPHNTSL